MHHCQAPYRQLFEAIHDSKPADDLFRTLLSPWLEAHQEEREWAIAFARSTSPAPIASEDSWRLYALSRVNQALLLAFQDGAGQEQDGPSLRVTDYVAFMTGIGCHVAHEPAYSPFFHEIVEVTAATEPQHEEIALTRIAWPALMLGTMLFSRAGVAISCTPGALQLDIAASSTLYWALHRKHRRTADSSDGWGSSSQWRTAFRRDLTDGNDLVFNADGTCDLATLPRPTYDDELTKAERIEVLTHRSFVLCGKPDDDLYPYNDRIRLPRNPRR